MNRFRLTDPGSPEGCVVELVEATKDKLTLRLIESD
jgi:hypothetical protein